MRRVSRLAAAVVAAVFLAVGRAAAQEVYFHDVNVPGDTAFGLIPGVTTDIPVYQAGWFQTLLSGRLTIMYDTAKVQMIGAMAGPAELATNLQVTFPAPGQMTVRGDGVLSQGFSMFSLQVQLRPGVSDGSFLWLRPDSMNFQFDGEIARRFGTGIGQLCHATSRYGDVDGDGDVDSRDALITLSAAVGLPVTGFQLANGEVDGDGQVNSRDALMMLSYSINLQIFQANRVGKGIPDACPGLTPPGEIVVLVADTGSGPQAPQVLAAASTTPVTVPNVTSFGGFPRLASNGTSIVYGCSDVSFTPQVCRIESNGTGLQQVTSGGLYAAHPDWDPAGGRIAYTAQVPFTVRHIGPSGALDSQVVVLPGFITQGFVAWNRTGTQLSYGSQSGLFVVSRDGQVNTPITISPVTISIFDITRWSPANDSIAFTSGYGPGVWAVPSGGGTPARVAPFQNIASAFDWGPQGILMARYQAGLLDGLWLLEPSGVLRRVTAGPHHSPAFRRNP